MERRFGAGFAAVVCASVVVACGGRELADNVETDGGTSKIGSGTGTGSAAVGSPCAPLRESSPTFLGASATEVSLESKSSACGGNACLTYHFRGLTYCPYGQSSNDIAPAGASTCTNPDGVAVIGEVESQCTDRRPADAVFCTCRCANAQGQTNDGYSYCSCGGGMTCEQVVPSIGPPTGIEGAYCVKPSAEYVQSKACAVSCDPTMAPCP
jgi:hypothetical protein